jgi:O-methyltransferase
MVNLDADLYQPTKAALEFFYSRLSPGGVIFIHDHNYKWEGIKKAVDEFATNIPENPVFVPDIDSTCMIIRDKKF